MEHVSGDSVMPQRGPGENEMKQEALRTLVDSKAFGQVVMAVILLNAITLGLETSERIYAAAGPLLEAIDRAALIFFTLELTLRLWAYRWRFFTGGWNLFDLAIVAVSWVPAAGAFSVLRSLRVFVSQPKQFTTEGRASFHFIAEDKQSVESDTYDAVFEAPET